MNDTKAHIDLPSSSEGHRRTYPHRLDCAV
eukprot:COSAG01_NODE_23435_length_815_cov_1.230447_1_plen_29_part_10